MAETLAQYLSYINEVLPSRVNSTTIITLTNNELRKHWRDMTSTSLYSLNTVANQYIYTLPTDCEFDSIVEKGILVSDSTIGSTSINYTQYSYVGSDDEAVSNSYCKGIGNTFVIYPTPEYSNYDIHIRYQARPTLFASSDTAVQFDINEDYIDLVRFRVMSRIAKSGNNPDVALGNNYEMDAMELEKKLKLRKALEKAKSPRRRVSYKEGW